ncbi:MAG: hypothetical protein IJT27_05715, partial [Clostridia bacterium]|nr:hypothetical protein [Clostridia bacterium]
MNVCSSLFQSPCFSHYHNYTFSAVCSQYQSHRISALKTLLITLSLRQPLSAIIFFAESGLSHRFVHNRVLCQVQANVRNRDFFVACRLLRVAALLAHVGENAPPARFLPPAAQAPSLFESLSLQQKTTPEWVFRLLTNPVFQTKRRVVLCSEKEKKLCTLSIAHSDFLHILGGSGKQTL